MESVLNMIFDKIYVLTIDRNADRHPLVRTMLQDIDFEFWRGFDAGESFPSKTYVSEIDESFFLQNNIDRDFAISSTIGQLGAYLSIKNMIDHIANSNFKCVLIFEDDALPTRDDWRDVLLNAINELPEDWDILMAGYFLDGKLYKYANNRKVRPLINFFNTLKKLKNNKKVIKKIPSRYTTYLDLSGYSTGGHAYCLSSKGSKILSKHLKPMRDSGDLLFSRLVSEEKIKSFSVNPSLFIQNRNFESKTETVGLI